MHISDSEQAANIPVVEKQQSYPENYIPIPKELSNQYKAEMERIIDEEYPKVITKIDECVISAEILYKKVIKDGYFSNNQMDTINLGLIYENCIPTASLNLYDKLLKITQEKYLKIHYEPLGTDWVTPYANILSPYLKDNNVSLEKLYNISQHEITQDRIIKKYINEVQKLVPTE